VSNASRSADKPSINTSALTRLCNSHKSFHFNWVSLTVLN